MIDLHLLGGVTLHDPHDEGHHSLQSQSKCLGVLSYLAAATPEGCHRRDKLTALFWPESNHRRARAALRKTLFQLRRNLGEGALTGCGEEGVGIESQVLRCDVVEFRGSLRRGDATGAVSRYRGDFMDGFHLGDLWEFQSWMDALRLQLRQEASEAAWKLAFGEEEAGNGVEAAHWARRAAGFEHFDEAVHQRLILLLDRLGDRSGALREHEIFARRLRSELELEPSPETLAIVAEVRKRTGGADHDGVGTRPGDSDTGNGRNAGGVAGHNGIRSSTDGGRNGHGGRPSVAVLPFATLTPGEESRTFADGLHQEVISQILAVGTPGVAARSSVLPYLERPEPPGRVCRALDVTAVLEGSVRVAGGSVRVSLDLVGAGAGDHLWSRTFQGSLEDPLRLQVRLAEEVAGSLSTALATV